MNDVTVVQPREARGLSFATVAVAFAGAVAMADAAVETFASGSPFRAWAAGAAAAYLILAAVGLRRRSGWRVQTTLLIIALLGLLAATAWLPGGSNNGVRFAGQPTARVLSGVVAGGLLVAIAAILRAAMLPLAARLLLVLPAIYGAAAFMVGAYRTTAFAALFAGESWWLAAPRWLQGGVVGGLVVLPLAVLLSVASWFARGRRSGMLQQTLALVLSEVIVLSGLVGLQRVPPAATGAGATQAAAGLVDAQTPGPAAAPQATADAIALIKQVATDPAAAPPDIDRKAAEIGNDPAALFAFVHDHIRTQVYSGVLRGARGVLTGGAGNAWDQSLLLAAMLKHHGRDVRFARAHLADADAARIVARMFADAARPRPSPPSITVSPALQRESQALLQRVRTTWRESYADVLAALRQGGMTLGDRAVTPQMLASEAADHVWVEYRDGDRWTPLDPVGADRPGVAVASAAETFAQIPDSLYHHVTIRVTAEVRQGQQFETKDVLRYQTTAEALHGEQVFLWHYFDHDIAGRWRARPLLAIGDQVYGAMKISAAGLVTVAPPRNDLIAQAHQAVGKDQLGQVTDLFKADDAKPAASSAGELAAERLEVDFADPSGHVDTVRRDLLDRIGIAARVAGTAGTAPLAPVTEIGNLPAQLATTYACAFAAGPLDPASVMRSLGHDTPALDAAAALQARTSAAITHAQESALTTEVTRGLPSMLYESALTALIMSQQLAHDPAGS